MSVGHICDSRCLGENGHHAWPYPREDECLCNQTFRGEKVYCPLHGAPVLFAKESLELRLVKALTKEEREKLFDALQQAL
jgi:hypothetical protein